MVVGTFLSGPTLPSRAATASTPRVRRWKYPLLLRGKSACSRHRPAAPRPHKQPGI